MSTHRWFVVAQFGEKAEPGLDGYPTSLAHAKEMGTVRTACGLDCSPWVKWWGQAFPVPSATSCRQCLLVVTTPSGPPGKCEAVWHRRKRKSDVAVSNPVDPFNPKKVRIR